MRSTVYAMVALVGVLSAGVASGARGQNPGLIQQGLEQVAKLGLYIEEAEKAYQDVQNGLSTISQIKKGDFDLHSLFFDSLMLVNPAVKAYVRVADIIAMQTQMLSDYKSCFNQVSAAGVFSAADLSFLSAVYSSLLSKSGEDIDELTGVLSDGDWQMNSAQRIARIDQLYNSVSEKYRLLRSFNGRVLQQAIQRQSERNSLENLLKNYMP